MTPIVNGLTEEFSGRVTVLQLDAAQPANDALLQSYGLRGHPTFVVLDQDGAVSERFIGPQDGATLRAALTDVVSP